MRWDRKRVRKEEKRKERLLEETGKTIARWRMIEEGKKGKKLKTLEFPERKKL